MHRIFDLQGDTYNNGQTKKQILLSERNQEWYAICLGYLAVSFTLGITARNAGMTAWQAMLTSLACNASAGQYAGFTVIAAWRHLF